jgi:hypothetical protein
MKQTYFPANKKSDRDSQKNPSWGGGERGGNGIVLKATTYSELAMRSSPRGGNLIFVQRSVMGEGAGGNEGVDLCCKVSCKWH